DGSLSPGTRGGHALTTTPSVEALLRNADNDRAWRPAIASALTAPGEVEHMPEALCLMPHAAVRRPGGCHATEPQFTEIGSTSHVSVPRGTAGTNILPASRGTTRYPLTKWKACPERRRLVLRAR